MVRQAWARRLSFDRSCGGSGRGWRPGPLADWCAWACHLLIGRGFSFGLRGRGVESGAAGAIPSGFPPDWAPVRSVGSARSEVRRSWERAGARSRVRSSPRRLRRQDHSWSANQRMRGCRCCSFDIFCAFRALCEQRPLSALRACRRDVGLLFVLSGSDCLRCSDSSAPLRLCLARDEKPSAGLRRGLRLFNGSCRVSSSLVSFLPAGGRARGKSVCVLYPINPALEDR